MIRLILFFQMFFFCMVGAFLVHKEKEIARTEATIAVYREMSLRSLGEVSI